ncbi:MAG: hypothetical protein JJE25_10400 [Bacteroidia bacterium]|nr:hypothetical protein [Bacteroidia bacterium]
MFLRFILVLTFSLSACRAQQNTPQPAVIKAEERKIAVEEKNVPDTLPVIKKKSFNFMLLLPVDLSDAFRVDSISPDSFYVNETIDRNIAAGINFYEGALLAVDSLRKSGYDIKLNIINVPSAEEEQIQIVKKTKYESIDVVFSMLRENSLQTLSKILFEKNILLVSCATNTGPDVKNNSHAVCVQPAYLTMCKSMGAYSKDNFKNDQFVIVTGSSEKEEERGQAFISELEEKVQSSRIRKINFKTGGVKALTNSLSLAVTNTLFIPSADEDFVATIFTALNLLNATYRFRIIGLPSWQYFESLDPVVLEKYNTHIFTSEYYSYSSFRTLKFREKFRNHFSAEPGDAAYLAFDSFMFLGKLLVNNELPTLENSEYQFDGLRSSYRFFRDKENDARENQYINILKLEKFKYLKINN